MTSENQSLLDSIRAIVTDTVAQNRQDKTLASPRDERAAIQQRLSGLEVAQG
jgi:hypothetical protein